MPKIDRSLFKKYDIRGVVGKNLSAKDAYLIGKGYGTFIASHGVNHISVGHDNRLSSEEICHALMEGLMSTGCHVYDLGLTLTPIVDFSWHELKSPASVIVTASHSPIRYNGFKLALKKNLIYGEGLQNLYRLIIKGKFKKGQGEKHAKFLNDRYVSHILKNIRLKRKLNVVLDCGNGTASILAPQLLNMLGCNMKLYHCISDGNFPFHDPYPQKVESYKNHFVRELKTGKYDMGIAFDGDGDRMGIFDEKGNFIENDKIIYLHAKQILKKHKKSVFVLNVAISQAVIEKIEHLGGKVEIWKTGPPYMLSKMRKVKAILGGEISGHVAFSDRYFGYDDGIYTACRTLELLSRGRKKISSYFSDLPVYHSTPEFRVYAGEKNKFEAVEKISEELKGNDKFETIDVDGLRVITRSGWFLIRTSQTEPLVTGRIEAKSRKELKSLKKLVQELLGKEGIVLDWKNPIAKH